MTVYSLRLPIMMLCLSLAAGAQLGKTGDPLLQVVGPITLKDQTLLDGYAMISQQVPLSFSAEPILKAELKMPEPSPARFTSKFLGGTVRESLDWLCSLDQSYAWSIDGGTINLYPRAADADYVLNRVIPLLNLTGETDVAAAIMNATKLLAKPNQLAFLSMGGSGIISPWTERFTNITMRQFLNRTAERLGARHGWIITGAANFRMISFHSGLRPSLPAQSIRESPVNTPR